MKKLTLLLASIFAIATQTTAHGHGHANINSYADAFVFDEMGVTFSVYPDGEFDFYLGDACQSTTVSNGYVNVTFNSGYDYNPYVQYDDFGAVIQVENVPVWYDYYGRVSQIGDVMISYRNRRVCQVGGMYVYYNRRGHYAYHTGFINTWNPYFVYRPFYVAFARPVINLCFVRTTPYRQYYRPVRYTYYRPYVANTRPCYATIGHTYRPAGYGRTHGRYTQSAGRGEIAFKRDRRTVTTASARLNPSNRSNISSNRTTSGAAYSRNGSAVKPAVSGNSSRSTVTSNSRNVKPTITNRSVVSSKPRQVQTAPAQTRTSRAVNTKPTAARQSGSTVNRATKPSGNTVSRGNARTNSSTRTVAKPATSRTQMSTKPTVQRSNSNRSGGRTVAKPTSNTRSSNSSARTTSRSNSSVSKSAPVKQSAAQSVSKGSTGKVTSRRGK